MREARRGLVPSAVADMVKNGIGAPAEGRGPPGRKVRRRSGRVRAAAELRVRAVSAAAAERGRGQGEPGGRASWARPPRHRPAVERHRGHPHRRGDGVPRREAPPSSLTSPCGARGSPWTSEALYVTSKGKASTASLRDPGMTGLRQRLINGLLNRPAVRRGQEEEPRAPEDARDPRTALQAHRRRRRPVLRADAQLAVLLDADGEAAVLGEEEMELLGELEGCCRFGARSQRCDADGAAVPARGGARGAAGVRRRRRGAQLRRHVGEAAVRQQQLKLTETPSRSSSDAQARGAEAGRGGRTVGGGARGDGAGRGACVADYARYLGEVLAVTGQYAADALPPTPPRAWAPSGPATRTPR